MNDKLIRATHAASAATPADHRSRVARFVIAIPTFRRPGSLRACLDGVLEQVESVENVNGWRMVGSVLVVDNDPAESARETATATHNSVRYVPEPRPGIANARNRALAESTDSDLLVFIDDDEYPQPAWLVALLLTWTVTHGAAVMGRVVSKFEVELSPWVAAGDFFWRKSMPTGTEIPIAAAGNLLLDLNQIRAARLSFDANLGLGGGEDTLFSLALTRAGGRIVWCDESIATDMVPAERCTVSWVLRRSWSHGNNAVWVTVQYTEGYVRLIRVRLAGLGGGLLRIGSGFVRSLFGLAFRSKRHQARGLRTAAKGGGMVLASLGVRHYEYARK